MDTILAQRKKNWVDFASPSSSVNRLLVLECGENMPERPLLWWENAREREEWAYERYMRMGERVERIPDNTLPYLSMVTGTEIFAEAFGCPVQKPLDNNPFARPLIFSVRDLHTLRLPKWEDTHLADLFDMADHLRARAGADALFGLPDIQSPMDIAALIWEKSDFFAAMYEEPEAVHELAAMVKTLLFSFFDAWFARYGTGFIAHYPDYYMPSGITVSEDEIGAVSEEMYREFFEQELHDMAEHFGAIGIHCCADSRHQWKNLRRVPHLKILNLVRDEKQTLESLDVFRSVCGQYPGCALNRLEGIAHPEQLHLALYSWVPTVEEGRRKASYFAEYGVLP